MLALCGVLFAAGCANVATRDAPYDPLEGVNRVSHGVNKAVDAVALRPASAVYGAVVPNPIEQSVDNFATNLDHPLRTVNSVLQGRLDVAGMNFLRFLVNTTFGLGGLFDPATDMGLPEKSTGFGETLHVWGAGEGAYLELPFVGPSNLRDTTGRVVDVGLNPLRLLNLNDAQTLARGQMQVANTLGDRSRVAPFLDPLLYESADSYAAARGAYIQARRAELGIQSTDFGGEGELDPFNDPFDDPFDDPVTR